MNILVAAGFEVDSVYANAINTIKIADGFAKLGHEVTVVCREPRSGIVSNQELRERFHLCHRVTFFQTKRSRFGIRLSIHSTFANQVLEVARIIKPDFAYCRNYIAPIVLAELGIPTVAESHAYAGYSDSNRQRMLHALRDIKQFRSLITIAPILRNRYISLGAPAEKVYVMPDAVDIDLFTRPSNYIKSPRSRPRIVYAGHLYDYKGIPSVLEAANARSDWDFQLVGGHDNDIAQVASEIKRRELMNVSLVGRVAHSQVNEYLWDADVLLLPPSAKHASATWTSPVKLGEYLASGTPIVATGIPALRFWLNNGEVFFVDPDDGWALVHGIESVLKSPTNNNEMVSRGLRLASKISYHKRCSSILSRAGIKSKSEYLRLTKKCIF